MHIVRQFPFKLYYLLNKYLCKRLGETFIHNITPFHEEYSTLGGRNLKAFFIGSVIFMLIVWIFLSTEHGKEVGNSILDTIEDFFGSGGNNDCGGDDDE